MVELSSGKTSQCWPFAPPGQNRSEGEWVSETPFTGLGGELAVVRRTYSTPTASLQRDYGKPTAS